jgi:transposase
MPKYDEWLTDEGLLLVEGWARDGLIDEQIAGNMGISTSTFYEWKKNTRSFRTP